MFIWYLFLERTKSEYDCSCDGWILQESYEVAQQKSSIASANLLLTIDDDLGYTAYNGETYNVEVQGLLGCASPRRMYASWDLNQLRAGTLSHAGKYELAYFYEATFMPYSAVSFASPKTDTKTVWDVTQRPGQWTHYSDVIMSAMASQITSLTIVHSAIYI